MQMGQEATCREKRSHLGTLLNIGHSWSLFISSIPGDRDNHLTPLHL